MKPFQYSLQAVRTLREQQEQTALHDYGRALRAAEQSAEKLASVRQELEAVWLELQNAFAGRATSSSSPALRAPSLPLDGGEGWAEEARSY